MTIEVASQTVITMVAFILVLMYPWILLRGICGSIVFKSSTMWVGISEVLSHTV